MVIITTAQNRINTTLLATGGCMLEYHLPRPSLPQIPPSHSRSTITETSWNRTSNGGVSIHPYKANQSPGQQHDQVTPGSSSHTGPSPQTSNSTTTAAQLRYSSKGDKTLTIGEFLDPGDRMIHAEDPKAPFYLRSTPLLASCQVLPRLRYICASDV